MTGRSLIRSLAVAGLLMFGHGIASAQTTQTPQQIQIMIADGHARTALADLRPILRAHPQSGVAWYLTAEAQDALGNRPAARTALAKAESAAPGLPFAKPDKVAALKAHLAGPAPAPLAPTGFHMNKFGLILIALLAVFFIVRIIRRSRQTAMRPPQPYGFGNPNMGMGNQPPYGPAGPTASGSGLGSALLSGLATGAAFVAGERIVGDLLGNQNASRDDGIAPPDPQAPDRDDGLSGSPDWNDNNQPTDDNTDFDPDNNW
ncbi:tetratricopeptide repeat-containing protein [Acidiphilium sp. PA]|uniref:tetratricopeptide repeat-containing protein n=1 Tax=Acidiphilium sp. PA TaxID=2871705 RepID=UPI002242DFC0|nr:tetratricopeptide repeat-containing protein [Acidiphilium sp. PA]MCW8307462.1 tetratricopeptide repeat-containing protein [Acidiphilium sp. PA]